MCILHREIHADWSIKHTRSKSEIKLTWNRNELPKGGQERQLTSTYNWRVSVTWYDSFLRKPMSLETILWWAWAWPLIFSSGVLVLLLVFACPFFSVNGQCKSKIKIATPCIGSCFHALSCVVTPWQCSSCCCSWLQRHRYTFVHTAMHDTFSISGLLRRWPFHLVLFNFFTCPSVLL